MKESPPHNKEEDLPFTLDGYSVTRKCLILFQVLLKDWHLNGEIDPVTVWSRNAVSLLASLFQAAVATAVSMAVAKIRSARVKKNGMDVTQILIVAKKDISFSNRMWSILPTGKGNKTVTSVELNEKAIANISQWQL